MVSCAPNAPNLTHVCGSPCQKIQQKLGHRAASAGPLSEGWLQALLFLPPSHRPGQWPEHAHFHFLPPPPQPLIPQTESRSQYKIPLKSDRQVMLANPGVKRPTGPKLFQTANKLFPGLSDPLASVRKLLGASRLPSELAWLRVYADPSGWGSSLLCSPWLTHLPCIKGSRPLLASGILALIRGQGRQNQGSRQGGFPTGPSSFRSWLLPSTTSNV